MKRLMTCLALGSFATLLAVATAPVASAQTDQERSIFTLTEPLEVGTVTLQPGTYLIKVVLLESNRDMLRVSDRDETKVFVTVLSRPHPILQDEVIPMSRYITWATPAGQPKALRTWFARDTSIGHDVIYPTNRALELAVASKESVIAIPDATAEADYKTVALTVVTPEKVVKPYQAPVVLKAPAPAPPVVAEARPHKQLPKTASDVPLWAALGLLALGGAFGLRTLANRMA